MTCSAHHCSTHPVWVLLYLLLPSLALEEGWCLCRRGLSRKTAYTNQSGQAHKFRGCIVFMELCEGEFGSCQRSQLGLVSARPHLVKSKCLATENKPCPLMPLTSCTKSLTACWYLGKSRYPLRCQLSCKIEIASFVTGSMPRNTSGSRVLAVFVLCSQQETICW